MVVKNNLIILFQNQLVEYIHTVQSHITPILYDQLKDYFMRFKQGTYPQKMEMLVEFINNLMEFNHAIISKDSSIFASDDLIYGQRPAICLIPSIDFRPLVKINEPVMWTTIQKMYIIASRIIAEDPEYNTQITKNIFDSFVESMNMSNVEYKSGDFLKKMWKNFLSKLNNDKELYEFKNKCTTNISMDELVSFVKANKTTLVKMVKHIIYISNDTFNEESNNINIFDLRDDFITLLETLDSYIANKDNRIVVKGLLNIAKNIPFFVNLQEEYKQKLDFDGAHIIIEKIICVAKEFDDSQNILSKVKEILNKAIVSINQESFDTTIEKYIDTATKQVSTILPMLTNLTTFKETKPSK